MKEFYEKQMNYALQMIEYYNNQSVIDALGIDLVIDRLYYFSEKAKYFKRKMNNEN